MIDPESLQLLLPEPSSGDKLDFIRAQYYEFSEANNAHYVIPDGSTVPIPVADSVLRRDELESGCRVVVARQRQRQFIVGRSGGIPKLTTAASYEEVYEGVEDSKYITSDTLHKAMGRVGFDVPIMLDRSKSYMSYSERNNNGEYEDRVRITVLPSGSVVMSGLVFIEGTPTPGTIIGTFPSEYAPQFRTLLPVNEGDVAKAINVYPDGTIRAATGWVANTYLSLDGIGFVRSGYGTWSNLTISGSLFEAHNTSLYGTPAYWKDEFGCVWWRGAVRIKASGAADDSPIAAIPTSIAYPKQGASNSEGHYRAVANDALGVLAVSSDSLKVKLNTPFGVSTIIHLSGLVTLTEDAMVANERTNIIWAANGWANYGAPLPNMGYLRRPDGLRFLYGLIRTGALGQTAFVLPDATDAPQLGTKIFATVSNTGYARLDIGGSTTSDNARKRRVFPQQGGNGWYSLDGKFWIP